MSTPTSSADVVTAAMSIAKDAAEGRLAPTELERQAVTECRDLFGTVAGPGDSLWDLHRHIARQVLALDGVAAEELSEWLAVSRQRAGEPQSDSHVGESPPTPEAVPSGALGMEAAEPELAEPESVADAEPEPEPVPTAVTVAVIPPRRTDRYDPFRGWDAARHGFLS